MQYDIFELGYICSFNNDTGHSLGKLSGTHKYRFSQHFRIHSSLIMGSPNPTATFKVYVFVLSITAQCYILYILILLRNELQHE